MDMGKGRPRLKLPQMPEAHPQKSCAPGKEWGLLGRFTFLVVWVLVRRKGQRAASMGRWAWRTELRNSLEKHKGQ